MANQPNINISPPSGGGEIDSPTRSSPDPNQLAKTDHATQVLLNGHTTELRRLSHLLETLIKKNNLKIK